METLIAADNANPSASANANANAGHPPALSGQGHAPSAGPKQRLAMIDILDRDGRAKFSVPIHKWPVRIGRALDNDIVLDDPSVAAHHCTLGHIEGVDAPRLSAILRVGDSRNGVRVGRKHVPAHDTHQISSEQEWQMGQTRLRLRLAAAELAPEQPVEMTSRWSTISVVLGIVALLGLSALDTYITSSPGTSIATQVQEIVLLVLVLGLWALTWALTNKMFQHRMAFWRHVKIAAWSTFWLQLLAYLLAGLSFAFSLPILFKIRPELPLVVVAIAVAAHLSAILPRHRRAVRSFIAVALVTFLAGSLFMHKDETGRWFEPYYASSLPHPSLRMVCVQSVENFLQNAATMQTQLQEAVRNSDKNPPEDEEDLAMHELEN